MTPAANAQTSCQSYPLAFDIDQAGAIEQSDCTIGSIGPLRDAAGEYLTLPLTAGDFIFLSVSRRSRDDLLEAFILDPSDNVIGRVSFGGVNYDRTSKAA